MTNPCGTEREFDLQTNSAASSLIQSCEAASALSALEGECASTGLGDGITDAVADEYEVLDSGDSFQNIDQAFRKCTGSSTWCGHTATPAWNSAANLM